MVYAERNVGFWLAYLLPLCVYCLAPIVFILGRNRYSVAPPSGSAFLTAIRVIKHAGRGKWLNPRALMADGFWDWNATATHHTPAEDAQGIFTGCVLAAVGVAILAHLGFLPGSTAGLGARFAHVLADAGATVVVTGRRTERIEEVVDAISRRGGSAHGVRLDVADPASRR